ncbi:TetR/AcrR family transcriptional regulator [uncultured Pseudacidovorax sp.]|uniref:TetR/AcrR family transcriptional regulator n=1 Tax=uncultured Pseudacidovorax sp. TaxID=679313 RepID=UPI0025FB1177|nr:TetR/AcrR family transcriptional regulator [uncultured Pseudacidovorax sp.]
MTSPALPVADLPARDRILATAHDLFYRDGIRATGVDRLIAESGVAKLTFYRHFPSKDALVRAFLDHRHDRWMAWFIDALGRHGAADAAHGGARLLLLVDVLEEWCAQPDFRGCAFINTVVELGPALPEAAAVAQAHKAEMTQVIAQLLPDGPLQGLLADAAALAFDGAIVRAQMAADPAGRRAAAVTLRGVLSALVARR